MRGISKLALTLALLCPAAVFAGFAGTDVYLPSVGSAVGVAPWYTTVWVYNPGSSSATINAYLLKRQANPYAAGTGLTLTGSQLSVDTTVIQARVSGTCAAGSSIRVVNADGTVTCETPGNTNNSAAGYFLSNGTDGVLTGVWADLPQGSTTGAGYAGWFVGDVRVQGTLSKSAGSFTIDHPLDPLNKTLSHSFVESPDMMNVYNGNVALDEAGEAWVELPEWFEVLNRDFRYQLTCIGGFAPIYIASEIASNRFQIAGGRQGLKVSWQVTGIRRDAYAQEHPILVEQEKLVGQQGKYLCPECYGQPRDGAAGEQQHAFDPDANPTR